MRSLYWLGLAFIAAALESPASQRQVFTSGAEAVRVDVLVTEGGRAVRGLRAADFELRDDGVLQQIALVDVETTPVHVVRALDTSASLAGARIGYLRSAAQRLVTRLATEDRVSLVTFDQAVIVRANQSAARSHIEQQLELVRAQGPTALVDGVAAGLALVDPAVGRSLCVVFSDGVDTASWLEERSVLSVANRMDAVVYGVSTARGRDNAFLRGLTSATGGRLFEVPSLERLTDAFVGVIEEFRSRYILVYPPANVAGAGWHRLDVKVKGRASVNARRGYYARQ